MRVEEARGLWSPEGVYLNSATYGLPPAPAWDALQAALESWRAGTGAWERWADETDRARRSFARLAHVEPERVAVGASAAELTGLVAAALPDGARILTVEGDFTSLLFPFAARGFAVDPAPLDRLAKRIEPGHTAIAFSAVQSSNGVLADLDAIVDAAAAAGALTVLDATHACGWLPFDAGRFDAVVCAAYKWLLAPRGVAFLVLGDRLLDRVPALHANWFAGDDIHAAYYGLPLRLSTDARRLDTSPAWFSWVGAAESLAVLESVGVDAIHGHNVGLANRFRAARDLEPSDSAIVSLAADGATEKLARANVHAATRAGSARLSFHLYNTEADADAAAEALA